jgi:hypothetical protein
VIITAEDPQNDPLTVAVLPMAIAAGGGPVVKYSPGAMDLRGQRTVIFLGHGHPGGSLVKVDATSLIADLAHADHGVPSGADLRIWSCFGTAGVSSTDTLVAKLKTALAGKGITISGVPGALYTDIRDNSLWSGPTKPTQDTKSDTADVIKDIEGHAWAESGMMGGKRVLKADKFTDDFQLKTVNVTIGGQPYQASVKQIVMPPNSIDIALDSLVKNGKLAAKPIEEVDRKAAVTAAVKEWYRIFFEHAIIRAYVDTRVINRWADVQTTVHS